MGPAVGELYAELIILDIHGEVCAGGSPVPAIFDGGVVCLWTANDDINHVKNWLVGMREIWW